MELEIREPTTAEELEKYYHLRWRILRAPWTPEKATSKDEYEQQSIHLTAWTREALVGAGRFHFLSRDLAQVRSMAVELGFERQGIGSLILQGLEQRARRLGAKCIVLNARQAAIPFYRKHGYQLAGRSYTLFNAIDHWQMNKYL